jgi:anti-anti-sigma factor
MNAHSYFDVRDTNGIVVVELKGQYLGGEETETLRTYLGELANQQRNVILDMQEVTFVNSSFLSALLASHTHANRRAASIRMVNLRRSIRDLLELTRMDKVLSVDDSIDDAMASITGKAS